MHPKRLANPEAKRPKHKDKDWDKLVRRCWDAGWWCELRKSNYISCYPPDRSKSAIALPSTPSSSRSLMNYEKRLMSAGLPD